MTYPEMNAQIVELLKGQDNPTCQYAAERILELQSERDRLQAEMDGLKKTIDHLFEKLQYTETERDQLKKALEKSGWKPCGCPGHWDTHAGCKIAEALNHSKSTTQ